MKKFSVVMLVLVIMAMTMVSMVSCANEPKNSNEIDLSHEEVVIDDVRVGTKYNYGVQRLQWTVIFDFYGCY